MRCARCIARRPDAVRKLYLTQARVADLKPLLAWCAAHRVGYRIVEDADLQKLAASHAPRRRGRRRAACADARAAGVAGGAAVGPAAGDLAGRGRQSAQLRRDPALGRALRRGGHPAARARAPGHYRARPRASPRAAPRRCRWCGWGRRTTRWRHLRGAGFATAATLVHGGEDVFACALPQRLVYVMGAEGEGMDRALADDCDMRAVDPRQRRGGKPQRRRGHGGAARGVAPAAGMTG